MKAKITEQLSEIQKILAESDRDGKFHQLEKDIVLSKLRYVYEMVLSQPVVMAVDDVMANVKPAPAPVPAPPKRETPAKQAPVVEIPVVEKIEQPRPEPVAVVHEQKEETSAANQGINTIKLPEIDPPVELKEESIQNHKQPDIKQGTTIEIKPQAHIQQTVHQSPGLLQTKLKPNKINDISRAIGINDKILFVKQLFNGDHQSYINAVAMLNAFESFAHAENHIREMFDWDHEDPTVMKFMEIIKRRY